MLLLPGIIWAQVDARFAAIEKPSEFDFTLRALVFGLASYATTFAIFWMMHWHFSTIDIGAMPEKNVITVPIIYQILAAVAVGCVMAVLWLYVSTWGLLAKFLKVIRATKRIGDEDLWYTTFNAPDRLVSYAQVRDFDKKIVYAGWVGAFSESGKLRELTLYDAQLYDFEGNSLYDVPFLYLARKPDDIHIEFPLNLPGG